MNSFRLLLVAVVLVACASFMPSPLCHCRRLVPITQTYQSSDDNDNEANTINIAFISSSTSIVDDDDGQDKLLESVLEDHPFCKMTGTKLSIEKIPVDNKAKASSWSKEHITYIKEADIACFRSTSDVEYYLQSIDDYSNVPKDITDEERRKLPNTIDGTSVPATSDGGGVMAACPNVNTARECLNSGRFQAHQIYYPKDTQTSVELKTESLDVGEEEGKEEEVVEDDIDLQIWADSVIQACGDVLERKFWGGGW